MEQDSPKTNPTKDDDWRTAGKKVFIVLSLMLISAGTLAALKTFFHPPESMDFDFGWTCGFQFMMLYMMGDAILRQSVVRVVLFVFFIAIWTTAIFFASDMWL